MRWLSVSAKVKPLVMLLLTVVKLVRSLRQSGACELLSVYEVAPGTAVHWAKMVVLPASSVNSGRNAPRFSGPGCSGWVAVAGLMVGSLVISSESSFVPSSR